MGRRIRSLVPDFTVEPADHVKKRQQLRSTRHLPPLHSGDVVRIRDRKGWPTKAKVQKKVAPRSYRVVTEDGRELRRNRQHLIATPEVFVPDPQPDDNDAPMVTSPQPSRNLPGTSCPQSPPTAAILVFTLGTEVKQVRPVAECSGFPPMKWRYIA
ncbi:hypothetical protein HPB47_019023 [Ixodes persulcatus]|uniref:Uncharacterized protein n=1 Tax=Ixodes persulcatus TaxID=34615 RepID=A0AC60QMW5_IXOPE|nr:hypothetical protein HPB47_019023 [Ixodes persulcatus]